MTSSSPLLQFLVIVFVAQFSATDCALKLYSSNSFESSCSKMNHHSGFASSMDSGAWLGFQDNIFRPVVSALTAAEHGAREVFDPRPVPGYTHQLFGEIPTPGIWNANFNCSTPVTEEAYPFTEGNGAGSGATHDPRSISATR